MICVCSPAFARVGLPQVGQGGYGLVVLGDLDLGEVLPLTLDVPDSEDAVIEAIRNAAHGKMLASI